MVDMIDPDKPLLMKYEGTCLKVAEVAGILRVSEKLVRDWIKRGSLAVIPLPQKKGAKRSHVRIRGRSIDALINQPEILTEEE